MADVMKDQFPTLYRLFEQLKAELSERVGHVVLTDRLKLLLSVTAGVLILSALIGMHQMVSALEKDYQKAESDLARLETQIKTGGWDERKQQSQVLKSLLEERLWAAQTPGLADASFERWLRDRLAPYHLDPIQQIQVRRVPVTRSIDSSEPPNALTPVQRMTAKLLIPFDAQGLSNFLADIAEADRAVVIDRMSVRTGRNARVDMDVSAFYRTADGTSGTGP